jgi:predicted N-acetyltransferase YhbS
MTSHSPEMPQRLGQDLVLRSVHDAQDAQRYVALSEQINGAAEGQMCERLIQHHPRTIYADYVMVEDEHTGAIASTTCLIPWQLQFDGVTLDAAMLEMVVTHPAYRRRGLVRVQIEHFHRTAQARGFDLSIIQGIPHYYRQYGYAYALDHQPAILLPACAIPAQNEPERYRCRQGTTDDLATLTTLHAQALSANRLYTLRDPAYWRYLMEAAHWDVQLLELPSGQPQAYFAAPRTLEGQPGIDVPESGALNHAAAMALLRQLKTRTPGMIRLGGTGHGALMQAARSLGGTPLPCDQWLLRITDMPSFLAKIGPALERRLAQSDCAGLSASLCINLYREAFLLRFEQGKLIEVKALGFVDASLGADGGDLCIPRDAFVRLLVGYRTLDELRDAWPDSVMRPASRHLLYVLFPRLASCVWMPY